MNTYGEIGNQTAGYYIRQLLRKAMPVLVLERFGLTQPQPPHETKIIQFRRRKAFRAATIPLIEGVTPQGSDFGYDNVSAQIQQYGDYSEITDVIHDTSKDKVLRDISLSQGEQIAETLETLTWDIVRAGTNVVYGGSITARTSISKTSVLNAAKQRSATTFLDAMKGKMFTEVLSGSEDYETYPVEAAYIAVCHSNLGPTVRDLKGSNNNDTFTPYSRYGPMMKVVSPRELGSFEDTRYVTSPDLPPFSAGGSAIASGDESSWYFSLDSASAKKYDAYPVLYLGREAFGCIPLRGKKAVKPAILRPDMPRGGDPIGQRGSAGWKTYFACVILNETWMRRLEVACPK